MLFKILSLELRKNIKSPALYIFFVIFFVSALIFTLTTDPYTRFMGVGHGKEWHNAPIIIAQILARMGVIGLLFTMVIIGRSVAKDFESNIHELIFTRPVTKLQYLGGRFMGSFTANLLIFSGIILAFEFGILFLDEKYSGPFQMGTYLLPFALIIIPNLILMGAVLFALSTLTRKMTSTYLAGIAFLAIYAIFGVMLHRMENETLQVLADPFGITSLSVYTKFWTVTDMNQNLMPVNTTFLINRIIWFGVSLIVLAFTYRNFAFTAFLEKKRKKLSIASEKTELIEYDVEIPQISIAKNKLFTLSQCLAISWRDFRRIVIHPAFLILTALAISEIVSNFFGSLGNQTGHIYPFTSWFIRQTLHIWIYMLPMTIFFGGMLVWKEKDYKTDEIINTLPIPNWFNYTHKLLTLVGIYILYLGLTMVAGIVSQVVAMDFTEIELGLYIKQLFGVDFFIFLHMAIIVLFIQNLSPNKYVGFFWSALFFVVDMLVFGVFEFDNYLLRFGRVPEYLYSNINGFGHYGQIIFWYTIYWLFMGAIIAWFTILLWRRTNENSIKTRLKHMRSGMNKNQLGGIMILFSMFIVSGFFIGYNKYILNPYISENSEKQMQTSYEKKFSKYLNLKQPTIIDIKLNVDLIPETRRTNIKGEYVLYNWHNKPIKEILVNLNDWNLANLTPIQLNKGFIKKTHAEEFGFRVFELNDPMLPGDTLTMGFQYDIIAKGFTENQPKNEIVENGTCLILSSFSSRSFPVIGYNLNLELIRDKDRLEFDLPLKTDAPKLAFADKSNAIFAISRPNYEATISTSIDQKVISCGHLEKNWQEGGRNYFHYKSDTIIENEICIISGRYDVNQEEYNGVNVEVYYHPRHNYNISSIMGGLKDSYDYGNKYFSKYPYKDLRIVEIPDYMTYGAARHFPTTFVWSESEGFITRFEENDIDMVYAIAAHENAHHWWAGIVSPAFAEGAFLLTESICQYTMAMLTEKTFGTEISRDYRKLEMESYLQRRKHDQEGEKSLMESSVQQSYIGYKKSTSAMYALQDYISEDSVGKALGRIVKNFGYRLDTFALATDLINEFKKVTPDSLLYVVDDLFARICLYENKMNSAKFTKLDDGKYEVELDISTSKYYADSVGNQNEANIRDYISVGILDEDEDMIYYKKHLFTKNQTSLQIIINETPAKAGIDPNFILVDRELDDNFCVVEEKKMSMASVLFKLPAKLTAK